MADAASLKIIGFLLASVTAAVILVAGTLVTESMAQGPNGLPATYSWTAE
jgi:hypothetical protein